MWRPNLTEERFWCLVICQGRDDSHMATNRRRCSFVASSFCNPDAWVQLRTQINGNVDCAKNIRQGLHVSFECSFRVGPGPGPTNCRFSFNDAIRFAASAMFRVPKVCNGTESVD